jgi:large subunit ribosomal protein L9
MVEVKPGYARNFLLPSGRAKVATPENVKLFEERRAELEKLAAQRMGDAEARFNVLNEMSVAIAAKAGTEGKLFGSIGPADIADALAAAGVPVEKREIRLPEGPLRQVGEFEVDIHLHTDVNARVKVQVEAEQ